jgi:hypothetical protein
MEWEINKTKTEMPQNVSQKDNSVIGDKPYLREKIGYMRKKIIEIYEDRANLANNALQLLFSHQNILFTLIFALSWITAMGIAIRLNFGPRDGALTPLITPGMSLIEAQRRYISWEGKSIENSSECLGLQSYIRLKEINQINFLERNEMLTYNKYRDHKDLIDSMTQLNMKPRYHPTLIIDFDKYNSEINELFQTMNSLEVTGIEEVQILYPGEIKRNHNLTIAHLETVHTLNIQCKGAYFENDPLEPIVTKVTDTLVIELCQMTKNQFKSLINSISPVHRLEMSQMHILNPEYESYQFNFNQDSLHGLESVRILCNSDQVHKERYIWNLNTLSHFVMAVCKTEAQNTLTKIEIDWGILNSVDVGRMIYQSDCNDRLIVHCI